jgi:tetratricopeptide (TPR) repeat protein
MPGAKRTPVLLIALLAPWFSSPAWAQLELVDPDAPAVKKSKPPKDEQPPPEDTDIPDEKPFVEPPPPRAEKVDAGTRGQGKVDLKKADSKKAPEPPPAPKVVAVPLVVSRATDQDLDAAWEKWRLANNSPDAKAEATARLALLKLKKEIGAEDLEAFSQGMIRAALAHESVGDAPGAIDIALAAVELAPEVPASWVGLGRVYFAVDPTELPRVVETFKTAAIKLYSNPRYFRPAFADFANALLTTLTCLAVAVVLVLFARRARYFFYDFHFLFPRMLARWQSTAVAVLILLSPVVFRMGVAPALLAGFAAVALYLSTAERVVATLLVGLLGAMPTLAALTVEHTAFARTSAETAYLLEKGGEGADALAQKVARVASEDKASFAELFALGRFELRRGRLDLAIPRLKAALLKRPNDPRASVNLGVAMLLTGDLENPKSLFEDAAKADPTLAEPLFNLSQLYQRRGVTLGADVMASELDRSHTAMADARARNPALADPTDPAGGGDRILANRFLLTLPLSTADLLSLAVVPEVEDRIRSQLTLALVGDVPEMAAPFFPALAALLLFGLGFLASSLAAAKACTKCGLPVSRRGDPELSKGSLMCTQCINVFARKGVVPPALKVRKQLEVSRYQIRMERLSYALGVACGGMGHVFSGLAVRGAIYGFLFLLAIVLFLGRNGVMRAPYEAAPMLVRLVPLGVLFLVVYLLSLRGLYKRQN